MRKVVAEILTVQESEDGREVKIQGTTGALELLNYLLTTLLSRPAETEVEAINDEGCRIVVERVEPEETP